MVVGSRYRCECMREMAEEHLIVRISIQLSFFLFWFIFVSLMFPFFISLLFLFLFIIFYLFVFVNFFFLLFSFFLSLVCWLF